MRTDSNRLLVGGVNADTEANSQPTNVYARRHLAEIIIGLVIVFFCLWIFIPVFVGTAESARRTICVSHLRRLAQALEMYQDSYDGLYPPTEGWMRALYPQVLRPASDEETDELGRRVRKGAQPTGAEIFFCPSEENLPHRRKSAPGTGLSSYSYRQPALVGNDPAPFAWDSLGGTGQGAHPNGGNVAYLDGRVVWRPSSQWAGADQP